MKQGKSCQDFDSQPKTHLKISIFATSHAWFSFLGKDQIYILGQSYQQSDNTKMDPQPHLSTDPLKDYDLYCNPLDPESLVMLKNIDLMGYMHKLATDDDGSLKIFPNYYILNNLPISHPQKAIFYAMVQQRTCPAVMTTQFCKLAQKYYEDTQKKIPQFLKTFEQLTPQKYTDVLRWYTEETFFYKLLNRLLRAGTDITQLYHGQYFVKLLSQAIQFVYKKQKHQKQLQTVAPFKCYRGAYFTEKQLKQLKDNVGKHIQTLGFLSTSLDKKKAEEFMTNCIISIKVSDRQMDKELDKGYAFLSQQYSAKYDEEEVLFNVLSSFIIRKVEKVQKRNIEFWHISLQYGVTYYMMNKYNKNKTTEKRGSIQHQQILAILSRQKQFGLISNQQKYFQKTGQTGKLIELKKTKLILFQGNPKKEFFQVDRKAEEANKKLIIEAQYVIPKTIKLIFEGNFNQAFKTVREWKKINQPYLQHNKILYNTISAFDFFHLFCLSKLRKIKANQNNCFSKVKKQD